MRLSLEAADAEESTKLLEQVQETGDVVCSLAIRLSEVEAQLVSAKDRQEDLEAQLATVVTPCSEVLVVAPVPQSASPEELQLRHRMAELEAAIEQAEKGTSEKEPSKQEEVRDPQPELEGGDEMQQGQQERRQALDEEDGNGSSEESRGTTTSAEAREVAAGHHSDDEASAKEKEMQMTATISKMQEAGASTQPDEAQKGTEPAADVVKDEHHHQQPERDEHAPVDQMEPAEAGTKQDSFQEHQHQHEEERIKETVAQIEQLDQKNEEEMTDATAAQTEQLDQRVEEERLRITQERPKEKEGIRQTVTQSVPQVEQQEQHEEERIHRVEPEAEEEEQADQEQQTQQEKKAEAESKPLQENPDKQAELQQETQLEELHKEKVDGQECQTSSADEGLAADTEKTS